MKAVRMGIVAGLAVAATFAAPAQAQAPDPVKELFITTVNTADEVERQAIDTACWILFDAEPGSCPS